ncbi:uncharacterized protein LOC124457510 [Xenia sp. Carnegie-2017]|uniref:uncharacterized protein LOC124457510 n=1 Tax=Xenia sp. Carnegie-2017 TaxID=2897299 RepID=UPI001F045484|nr:uncharacterized protein LOC124457510 [Xenia sp. Carnegie-2017]
MAYSNFISILIILIVFSNVHSARVMRADDDLIQMERKTRSVVGVAYVVKSLSSDITYLSAKTTCKADGKQLCPSFVICRDGKYPVGPVRFGDHWTPVKDAYNQWLQIGNNGPHKTCILHSSVGYLPSWGTQTSRYAFKGYVYCCTPLL